MAVGCSALANLPAITTAIFAHYYHPALVVVQQDVRARSRPLLLVVTTAWTARKKAVESARLRARRGPVALLTTAATHSYRFVEPSSSLQFEV